MQYKKRQGTLYSGCFAIVACIGTLTPALTLGSENYTMEA